MVRKVGRYRRLYSNLNDNIQPPEFMPNQPDAIPPQPIMDLLNRTPPCNGPMGVVFQPEPGARPFTIQADLYGWGQKVEFVRLFDDQPELPILKQLTRAVGVLLKAAPQLNLERAFWAYEDRTHPPEHNILVPFFLVTMDAKQVTRTNAGALPRKYLDLLLHGR
jgi:hypothetical protein